MVPAVVAAQVERGRVPAVAPEAHVYAQRGVELEVVPNLEFAGKGAHELVAPAAIGRQAHGGDRVHHFIVLGAGNHEHLSILVGQEIESRILAGVSGQLLIGSIDSQHRRQGQGGA